MILFATFKYLEECITGRTVLMVNDYSLNTGTFIMFKNVHSSSVNLPDYEALVARNFESL